MDCSITISLHAINHRARFVSEKYPYKFRDVVLTQLNEYGLLLTYFHAYFITDHVQHGRLRIPRDILPWYIVESYGEFLVYLALDTHLAPR